MGERWIRNPLPFPERSAENRFQELHCGVEVQHLGLEHLPAAECEQLLRDSRGPLGRPPDLVHILAHRCGEIGALEHIVGAAQHHRHHVVRLVGDAAGQLPDRLHPLRLAQTLLRVLPVGDIEADPGHVLQLAARIANHPAVVGQPANPAVREDDPELVVQPTGTVKGPLHRLGHEWTVVLVYPGNELLIAGDPLLRPEVVQILQPFVPVQRVGRQVPAPGPQTGRLHGQLQPLLTLP